MGTPRLRLLYHWKGYALYWIFFSFSRCFLTTSPFLWPARILWCANVQVFFWCQVSVLDVDICGPSMPRIMGLEGEQVWHYQHSHCLSVYSAKCLVSVHLLMHFAKCMRIASDFCLCDLFLDLLWHFSIFWFVPNCYIWELYVLAVN